MPRSASIQLIKYVGEALLAQFPCRVASGSSLVLAYHNVVPRETAGRGDASLHLAVDQFREHLRLISREADLVSLPVLLAEHGRAGRRVAVTFDDAYTGCLRLGVPACHDTGVQPTVFVAPALLGRFAPWDLWAQRGVWDTTVREHFLRESRGLAAAFAELEGDGLPEDYRIGGLAALQEAATTYRFDIGNHTQRHVSLGACSDVTAGHEVSLADSFLRHNFPGRVQPYLAYPYGIAPPQPLSTEKYPAATYTFLVAGGWLAPSASASGPCIPRLNVPAGSSVARFRAQLRGWRAG